MQSRKIPDYLPQAVLVTLFCCLPFGIVAIIRASEANAFQKTGDYKRAMLASESAKTWCWCGFAAGITLAVFFGMLSSA